MTAQKDIQDKNLCPVHGMMTRDHERRMDELRDDTQSNRDCLHEMRDTCKSAREKCQKDIARALDARVTTKTLIAVASLFVMVALGALTLFSVFIGSGIGHLKENDARIEQTVNYNRLETKEWRDSLDGKLTDLQKTVNSIEKKVR
jgi:hypothetical protein